MSELRAENLPVFGNEREHLRDVSLNAQTAERIDRDHPIVLRPLSSYVEGCPPGSDEFFLACASLALSQRDGIDTVRFLNKEVRPTLCSANTQKTKGIVDQLMGGIAYAVHQARSVHVLAKQEVELYERGLADSPENEFMLLKLLSSPLVESALWQDGQESSKGQTLALLWVARDVGRDRGADERSIVAKLHWNLKQGAYDHIIAAEMLHEAVEDEEEEGSQGLARLVKLIQSVSGVSEDEAIKGLTQPDALELWEPQHSEMLDLRKGKYGAALRTNTTRRIDYLQRNLLAIPQYTEYLYEKYRKNLATKLSRMEAARPGKTKAEMVAEDAARKRGAFVQRVAGDASDRPKNPEKVQCRNKLYIYSGGQVHEDGTEEFFGSCC